MAVTEHSPQPGAVPKGWPGRTVSNCLAQTSRNWWSSRSEDSAVRSHCETCTLEGQAADESRILSDQDPATGPLQRPTQFPQQRKPSSAARTATVWFEESARFRLSCGELPVDPGFSKMLHAGHLKVSSLFQQDLPARRGVANAHGRILPDGEEIIRFGEQSRSHAEFSHSHWSLQGCGISTVDLPVRLRGVCV